MKFEALKLMVSKVIRSIFVLTYICAGLKNDVAFVGVAGFARHEQTSEKLGLDKLTGLQLGWLAVRLRCLVMVLNFQPVGLYLHSTRDYVC